MRKLGHLLQVLGLVLLPLAILLQLNLTIDVRQMLAILLGSVSLFWIGRLVEGYAKS